MSNKKIFSVILLSLLLIECNRWYCANEKTMGVFDFVEPKVETFKPVLKIKDQIYDVITNVNGVKEITLYKDSIQNGSLLQNILLACPKMPNEHNVCYLLMCTGLPVLPVYYDARPIFFVNNKNIKKVKKILVANKLNYREIVLNVKKINKDVRICEGKPEYFACLKIYHRKFYKSYDVKAWWECKYNCYLDTTGAIVEYKLKYSKVNLFAS
jgi:hypothetical protein